MQGKAPGDEPLPKRQGQAQHGEGAENQVQDHCLFPKVVVRAIVIEPATARKRKSRLPDSGNRRKTEGRNPNAAEVNAARNYPGGQCLGGDGFVWQALGRPKGEFAPLKRRNRFGRGSVLIIGRAVLRCLREASWEWVCGETT